MQSIITLTKYKTGIVDDAEVAGILLVTGTNKEKNVLDF